MSRRSGMVSNEEGLDGVWNVNHSFNRAGPQLHYHVPGSVSLGSLRVKTDLSRNHCVHITLHLIRCYVMPCLKKRALAEM
jgi:hypothetical protein